MDVHGLAGGSPDLVKTVLPVEARANVSIRIAPGQNVADVSAAFERLLREAAPEGAERRGRSSSRSAEPGLVSPDAPALGLAREAFEQVFGQLSLLVRVGGSVPVVASLAARGIPTISTGIAIERRQRALAEREVSRGVPDARSRGGARDVQASRRAWLERRSRARSPRSSPATCSSGSSATCRVDTQGAYRVPERPSTEKQLELSRLLVAGAARPRPRRRADDRRRGLLRAPGIERGSSRRAHRARGHDARRQRAPDVSPIVHEAWDGAPIELPGDARQVLDPEQLPELAARVGHDIVTSDGTTLLGADDKAGIAEIMAAVSYLARHPERTRAPLRVAFTVDEEVGRGAEDFDLEAFGADVAYTLDGSALGELETETFSATSIRVTIRGLSVHPGTAKGKLVNAVKLAAELVASLPADRLSPETTENREGYVHPHRISGGAEEAIVDFIARDHDDELLEQHVQLLRDLAARIAEREPRAHVEIERRDSYRNMRPYIEQTRASSRRRSRRFAVPVSSRSSRSRAAGRTARCSRHEGFRPRISSPAARSTTRSASGRACRTWAPLPRRSSSSRASGPNRRRSCGLTPLGV